MIDRNPLADCPPSPNCVCSLASRPTQAMPPLRFEGDAESALEHVAAVLQSLPRVSLVEQRPAYLHATFTSLILRFVDDVEFYADSASRQLHFRSASRLGYSDLGANRRRMLALVQRLEPYGIVPVSPPRG
ncbi:MAG: DUF1499 domain-containing protein [Planctomycetales bacterium]|nr:DUF1499 domain-containing protein [Planctomycetales bacterium]